MAELTVRDLMSTALVTLEESEPLDAVAILMEMSHVRHIPVVRDGVFAGLLTHRDLFAAHLRQQEEAAAAGGQPAPAAIAGDVMARDVTPIPPETPAVEAGRALMQSPYGALPVVEHDKLVGIVTEADFLRLAVDLLEGRRAN